MEESIKNGNQKPTRWFGLHFLPGCAEYSEQGKAPYRVFLNESTVKNMDRTFEGCPVYVQHVDEVDFKKLEKEAAGIVVKSFWNAADGKTWAEFIIFSDEGLAAIKRGWRLSNAYLPKDWAGPGIWNGISYDREITRAEYEHLALVPNPRYDESIVLSPEQFKAYNENKELELKRLSNSKQGETSVLNFFKRSKVENSADLENTLVTLPKSKKDMSIAQLVELGDKIENMHGYASPDHMVKVNDMEEMSVSDLMNKYNAMCEEKKNAEEAAKEASKIGDEVSDEKQNEEKSDKKSAEKEVEAEQKKQNEADDRAKEQAEKAKKEAFNDSLKNAEKGVNQHKAPVLNLDKTALGKARYGSDPVAARK